MNQNQNQNNLFGHMSDPGDLCYDHIWSLSQRPPGKNIKYTVYTYVKIIAINSVAVHDTGPVQIVNITGGSA